MGRAHPAGKTGLCGGDARTCSERRSHASNLTALIQAPIFVAPEVPAGGGGQTRRWFPGATRPRRALVGPPRNGRDGGDGGATPRCKQVNRRKDLHRSDAARCSCQDAALTLADHLYDLRLAQRSSACSPRLPGAAGSLCWQPLWQRGLLASDHTRLHSSDGQPDLNSADASRQHRSDGLTATRNRMASFAG
jgi:hypothetical protein